MKILFISIAIITIAIIIAAAIFALDRLGRWLEDRGWIYYRKKSGSGGTAVGNALWEFHSMFDSDVKQARL